ncbi:MAG: CoA ester lyase [Candidatus Bathyarchaeia archaeon]
MPFRSMLFVPGNNAKMVEKAVKLEADAIILDLEDAVPIHEKENARLIVQDSIRRFGSSNQLHLFIRINSISSELYREDIDKAVQKNVEGLMIPKSETVDDVKTIETLLREREKELGLEQGGITFIPLIETAKGVLHAYELASASRRIVALGFGSVDFTADIGAKPLGDGLEINYPRAYISVAAHAARVQAIDTPWVNITDLEGLIKDCKIARQLGFTGKMAIHPSQLNIVNRMFSPTDEEITYAKKVVEAFEKALEAGLGATSLEGKMIDRASYRQAMNILQFSKLIEKGKQAL